MRPGTLPRRQAFPIRDSARSAGPARRAAAPGAAPGSRSSRRRGRTRSSPTARIPCTTLKPIGWSWWPMIHMNVIHTHSVHAHSAIRVQAARRLMAARYRAGPTLGSARGVLDRGEAALDRGARGVGQRHPHVGSGDAALRVQHALEHRGIRLRERGLRPPAAAPRRGARPSSSLPASPHSTIATNRAVHTCADAVMPPTPPMHTIGNAR